MTIRLTPSTIIALATLLSADHALAQGAKPPASEAGAQSSNMGLPAPPPGANNGVGTAGSIGARNGSASSTVGGVHGSQTGISAGSSQGAGGTLGNDPAMGGGSQVPK